MHRNPIDIMEPEPILRRALRRRDGGDAKAVHALRDAREILGISTERDPGELLARRRLDDAPAMAAGIKIERARLVANVEAEAAVEFARVADIRHSEREVVERMETNERYLTLRLSARG